MPGLPIYIDIDGTLTDEPNHPHGRPILHRIEKVRGLLERGHVVVLWSGNGTEYATNFAAKHDLNVIAIGKPAFCVDDNPTIRPTANMPILSPETYFSSLK